MKFRIFIIALILSKTISAQTNTEWLDYLKSRKDQFYLKDSIALTLEPYNTRIPPDYLKHKYLKPLEDEDCFRFFQLHCYNESERFFYSYYLTKNNYAFLTIYSFGKYTPALTLYNYSPSGEMLNSIDVRSDFGDAGQADSTTTTLINDSTLLVRRWDGWEELRGNDYILADSLTNTTYSISAGKIIQINRTASKSYRK